MNKKLLYFCLLNCFIPLPVLAADTTPDTLLDMSLDALMQVKLKGSVTLTPTATRRQPAAVTTITRNMIADSGARNLFDLFDMYVPNFQYLPHHWEAPHMGMRGIIGDREDKYLLVINGRVVNEQTHFGALSERDLPMLADIRKIDVIRGPGSVVYGPGAVSMVINIHTDSYADHGADGTVARMGVIEGFKSLELKKAIALSPSARHGLWLYGALSEYKGAENDDAPLVYGHSDTTTWGDPVYGGKPATFPVPNNHAAHRDQVKVKLHGHYQKDDFNAWARYTRGGEQLSWEHKVFTTAPNGFGTPDRPFSDYAVNSVGYEQVLLDASQLFTLNSRTWLELKAGYDRMLYERILHDSYWPGKTPENHSEEHYLLRATLNWNPNARHALAVGSEYVWSRWGLSSGRHEQPVSFTLGPMERWHTGSVGLFGEHQWQLSENLTQFVGLRADKDQYTDWMLSPRLAMIMALSPNDTLKAILSRSLRKNNAEELRGQHKAGQEAEHEQVSGGELIYQRNLGQAAELTLTGFYNKAKYVGIDFNTLRSRPVAEFTYGGFEMELGWKRPDWSLQFMHGLSKLDDFEVAEGASTRIAATHFGYGNDLNNWSNHSSKVYGHWAWRPDWKLTGNIRVLWGFPGAQDHINQVRDARAANPNSTSTGNLTDPGYDDSTRESIFLDLGLQHQLSRRSQLQLNGHNLLGFADKRYNKRLYLLNVGNYRAEAPALSLTWRYAF